MLAVGDGPVMIAANGCTAKLTMIEGGEMVVDWITFTTEVNVEHGSWGAIKRLFDGPN